LNKLGEIVAGFLGDAWAWVVKVFKWFKNGATKVGDFLAFIFGKHCHGSKICETIPDEGTCKITKILSGECRDDDGKDNQGECGTIKNEKNCADFNGGNTCKFYKPTGETGTCRWERDVSYLDICIRKRNQYYVDSFFFFVLIHKTNSLFFFFFPRLILDIDRRLVYQNVPIFM